MMNDVYWDPFDVDIDRDPYETWRRLRDDAPLYRNDRFDFYALSRFADVEAAHRDPVTFSSAHGTVLEMMTPEPMGGGFMIFMDPPDHTQLRSLVSRAFTPRRVTQLEQRIRDLCTELFDAQAGSDSFDYVQGFAARLPAEVIAALIGVPEADREHVRANIDRMFHIEPGVGMINDVSLEAGNTLNRYLNEQLQDRARRPRDDMLTDLVRAEITDEAGNVRRLKAHESTTFANLLISAGTETVARLLGNAAVVLAAYPEQRAELVVDPTLVPNAVEELLRYEAPSPVQGRGVTRDV
jgi:cytochrome P450